MYYPGFHHSLQHYQHTLRPNGLQAAHATEEGRQTVTITEF